MGQGCPLTNASRSKAGRPSRTVPRGQQGGTVPRGQQGTGLGPTFPGPRALDGDSVHTPFSLLRISFEGWTSQVEKRQKSPRSLFLLEIPVVVCIQTALG